MTDDLARRPSPPPPHADAQIHRAGVDLGGLMTVLGQHLYSTPIVALRELVQNAHDSIVRRRIEQAGDDVAHRIEVHGDPQTNTVRIVDTGAGLTPHEIHTYLATVGVGYTRTLRQGGHEDAGLIGLFGLGFLSAFVLARRVTLHTTSYQTPDQGWTYASNNAQQYTLAPTAPRAVGTEVVLELRDDFEDMASSGRLRAVIDHYCAMLRVPVHVGADSVAINALAPPWRDEPAPARVALQRAMAFATRFERRFEPLCCLPVVRIDELGLRGLFWIQSGATFGSNDNRSLSVYVRGMLLDGDARELLPSWATFVSGVIESDRLVPTASREDLQRDAHYLAVQAALAEALAVGMAQLAAEQEEAWRRVLGRHAEALLGASLCDDRLFELARDELKVPTTQGELRPEALVVDGALHLDLGADEAGGFQQMLFRAMGVPVALGNRYAVAPFLSRYAQDRGLRLLTLGTSGGDAALFRPATLDDDALHWLREHLVDDERLVAARFAPAALPLVAVADQEALLKQRVETDLQDKQGITGALRLARHHTRTIGAERRPFNLYVNLDNPTIAALLAARAAGDPRAAAGARLLKAVKVILGRDASAGQPRLLQQAFDGIARSVQLILEA